MLQSGTPLFRSLDLPLQYSGTALLLLVNTCMPHQNKDAAHPTYELIV